MTPEQKFWQLLKPHVPGHVNRIENSTGVGIPDVNFCFQGVDAWLELKVEIGLRFERVGDNVRVGQDILNGKIRDAQLIWHSQRVLQGGVVYLATRDGDLIHILRCCGYKNYMVVLSEMKQWDWDKIELCLKGGRK